MSQCSERVKHAVPPPFRFLRTFLVARAGGERQPPSMLGCRRRQGMRRKDRTGAILGWKRETAAHPPPRLAGPPQEAHLHDSGRGSRQYLCGYIDIIYSLSRNRHCRIAAPRFISAIQGFCAAPTPYPAMPPGFATPNPIRSPKAHKLVTNYARIAAIGSISPLALRLMHR